MYPIIISTISVCCDCTQVCSLRLAVTLIWLRLLLYFVSMDCRCSSLNSCNSYDYRAAELKYKNKYYTLWSTYHSKYMVHISYIKLIIINITLYLSQKAENTRVEKEPDSFLQVARSLVLLQLVRWYYVGALCCMWLPNLGGFSKSICGIMTQC
jgi:hypothetical protein